MSTLPIFEVLPLVCETLREQNNAVLTAPPGAGKTTQVPLALMHEPWCTGKILMFEPRRMAARAAALRMAELLNETVGATIGFRVRGETRSGPKTKVEVVTGGVLTRMLVEDPSLEGYSAVILDEFHERNLDADLALALTLTARELFREHNPLKLLAMSATLDGAPIAQLLDAKVIASEGRAYPVTLSYCGQTALPQLADVATRMLVNLLNSEAASAPEGDILVFLPGQREIQKVAKALAAFAGPSVRVLPLYSALPFREQQRAIAPLSGSELGKRKIILATDIAETSLTIEGVTVVVDGGFRRAPLFDPKSAMTRLGTQRISRASATQRAGRAGRTAPGRCYRLWAKEQTLEPFDEPEILKTDLTAMVLALKAFGVDDPRELKWLTPPPHKSYQQAQDLLHTLGALADGTLTDHGHTLLKLPVHPRLAHMLLEADARGQADAACALAALLHEDYRAGGTDLERSMRAHSNWPEPVQKTRRQLRGILKKIDTAKRTPESTELAVLLALAYPDRIARKVPGHTHLYRLSSGRQARLPEASELIQSDWLVAAELGGYEGKSEDTIFSALALRPNNFDGVLSHLIKRVKKVGWHAQLQRFVAEETAYLGVLDLRTRPIAQIDKVERAMAVCEFLSEHYHHLSWSEAALILRARLALGRELYEDVGFPNCSDAALRDSLNIWLLPYLNDVTTMADIKKLDLAQLLANNLTWAQKTLLDEQLPTHFQVPSGSQIRIDYLQSPPVLAAKLQEMFGQQNTPSVAGGRLELMVHLLSPAGRALQVTQDLTGFWRTGYQEVKKEMKGRYPKHPWPDDPSTAKATRHTKNRRTP